MISLCFPKGFTSANGLAEILLWPKALKTRALTRHSKALIIVTLPPQTLAEAFSPPQRSLRDFYILDYSYKRITTDIDDATLGDLHILGASNVFACHQTY